MQRESNCTKRAGQTRQKATADQEKERTGGWEKLHSELLHKITSIFSKYDEQFWR
jgi:hypothetical protein